jgi:ubiquinone/menaquinone biosynthesis C-methylase UbiE
MADQTSPRKEHPSTYVVQDRRNAEEMLRVKLQDQMITTSMGGPLPEQSDPSTFRRVLDVGCGTGNWLIETARAYPTIQLLIGVDVSATMLHYARTQVEDDATLVSRVEFAAMDALRMLEFADEFFDLVNERFGVSYLRTWDWWKFLTECIRVCRPGGVVRFTESTIGAETTSPALNQLHSFILQAFHRAGHLWTEDLRSVISELPRQFIRHGLQDIQTREYTLHYQAGTEQGDLYIADMTHGYRTVLPFLKKWTQIPDNYDEIYQQALCEMQQSDFEATLTLLTVCGTKSGRDTTHDFLHIP